MNNLLVNKYRYGDLNNSKLTLKQVNLRKIFVAIKISKRSKNKNYSYAIIL